MKDDNIRVVVDENGYKHYLKNKIGHGEQGITWQTRDPNIIVKIKVNPSTGEPVVDEEEYEKFKNDLDEVKILDLPEDIHIARPMSLLQKQYCGYTMRMSDGMQSIKYWIRPFDSKQSLGLFFMQTGGLRQRYRLLMNTAEIFAKLYAYSTVYADLSPENIFASKNIKSGEVWLIGADSMRYKFDVTSQIRTPGYAAPEVMKGEVNSLQADEYSYAVLAHEVLTLNPPFDGGLLTEEDNSNRFRTGVSPQYAFTDKIRTLFERNFGNEGRHNPLSRPKMKDWYLAMRQAVDLTAECQYCGCTFLFKNASCKCPFCRNGAKKERAKVIAAVILKRKNDVGIKIIDNMDGFHYLYNYHTGAALFSEKDEKTVEIEISKGKYTIRNLMNTSIQMSTANSDDDEIKPNGSKKMDSINDIILTMPERRIKFVLL